MVCPKVMPLIFFKLHFLPFSHLFTFADLAFLCQLFLGSQNYVEILDKQIKTKVIKVNDLPVAPIVKSCSLEYMNSKLTNIDEEEYKESE